MSYVPCLRKVKILIKNVPVRNRNFGVNMEVKLAKSESDLFHYASDYGHYAVLLNFYPLISYRFVIT